MQCPRCKTENPEEANFCLNCGARLTPVCSECGTELPPHARFCFSCGTEVTTPSAGALGEQDSIALRNALQRLVPREFAERLLTTRGQVTGERRIVTILFSDVKGSTTFSEHLDPEEVLEIMDGAFDVLIEPITRYEGALARLMGDGILAFFGAPIAHEDDAERACRAALDIIAGAEEYAAQLEKERSIAGFSVRVGIHTGLVVTGEVGSDLRVEYTAMGDAVNLASRMEKLAEPGTVLITEDTHRLIAPVFDTEALGPMEVRGRTEPVSAYRILAPRTAARKPRGIVGLESPMVGREAESRALREALERLQAGVGGIVTVVGGAGVGKSRLVAELRKEVVPLGLQWVEGRCLSYGTSVAYLMWLDVLRALLGVTAEDPPATVQKVLQEQVRSLCPDSIESVYPYLARLMSLPLEAKEETLLQGVLGERLKANTFRAVEALLECSASDRPQVLVCEDLHWADPTSIELLEQLLALSERAPLLLICAFRPYREHACWQMRERAARVYHHRHTDLWLEPLTKTESETLVGNLLRIETLPPGLRERILDHAEGNPFYVEEIIRSLIDSDAISYDEDTGRWQGVEDVQDIGIPDTLQGVLMARMDRLQEETRRVLQLASVIGRIFLYRVLAVIAEAERARPEPSRRELDRHLLTLEREEMIRERARLPELEYIFKHELTREAAYNGLLRRERRRFHRQVAEALEDLLADRIEEQVDLLAHHWERAEEVEKAIGYLLQAGDRAARLSAHEEAIAHFTRGLELLETLPDDAERAQQELALRMALGGALQATKDYADPEVGRTYDRARQLAEQLGDTTQLAFALYNLVAFHGVREELQTAYKTGQQLLGLTADDEDPVLTALPHWAAWILVVLGELHEAQTHLEQGIALYQPEEHHFLAATYGQDPAVACLSWASWTLWMLGYPEQALGRSQEALSLAKKLGYPYGLALAQAVAGCGLHSLRRDVQATQEWAEACIRLSTEHGFPNSLGLAERSQAWALGEQGRVEEGIARARQSIDDQRARVGGNPGPCHMFLLLAEMYGKAGRMQEGLSVLTEALVRAQSGGERYAEAEIHRLWGELRLLEGVDEAEVEQHYLQAIEIARRQEAKSWELRATVSLCRLWQRQGRVDEAREMLAEVYNWFTEGFDTADLKEAKALLEELSGE